MNKKSKIFIAGHNGMVGSSCYKALKANGYHNLIGKSSKELDLKNQSLVNCFIKKEKPDVIINAAAKVGGILANSKFPYEFLMDNMLIQNNLISSAHENDIKKFIFLGSSCIYPKFAPQPLREDYLLTDSLEPTNEWYAIAKISGLKLIEALKIQYNRDYISLMPTNLYGPNDNFDLKTSHVLPAMIRKFHEAKVQNMKSVVLWGSGSPMREFLHVDDLASAIIFSLENKMEKSLYNVGSGKDITIKNLAEKIKTIVGFKGDVVWDKTMPDGTPKKLLDVSGINAKGWNYKIELEDGISSTYNWFLSYFDI